MAPSFLKPEMNDDGGWTVPVRRGQFRNWISALSLAGRRIETAKHTRLHLIRKQTVAEGVESAAFGERKIRLLVSMACTCSTDIAEQVRSSAVLY